MVYYTEKPPIGLEPRFIWNGVRQVAICEAMIRYIRGGRSIPIEWAEELMQLCKESRVKLNDTHC
jgi:hypothetical protein